MDFSSILVLRYLIVAFLVLPFIDLWILVEIASIIGFWQTVGLVLATGLVGAEIVRREGRLVLEKLRTSVTLKEVSRNFLEAAMLLLAGLMLLSPGVVTDVIGILLVFRPLRERLAVHVSRRLEQSSVELEIHHF